jgi:hypothetical protein
LQGNILPDESGNNRNADCTNVTLSNTTGFGGGTVPISICRGVSTVKGSSTIVIPVIAFITRYSGAATNRILTGHLDQNYIIGHHSAKQGVLNDSIQWCTPILNLKPINNVNKISMIGSTCVLFLPGLHLATISWSMALERVRYRLRQAVA